MAASPGQALVEWERIRQYFQHAVELEPAEREIYLQSACGDDVLLRAEVRALLVQHDRASGLLATGPDPLHSDQFMLSPGDCLGGRFEIIRPLGAGGMGEVYEALDRELGARVALKALRPELIHDRKNRERFKNEILNGRKVTHPNICRIYDLAPDHESERACLAFTMELLDGETLAAHLERQPGKRLSVEEALPLVHQMADGLEALHQQGIVHRDFKPGNVILVRQGESTQARITDFGLAWRTEEPGPALSASTDIIGTPIYMAPEQLTGDRSKVSAATDVYALGLVLYEMVTGTRAYPAETLAENIFQKTQGPPAPPGDRVPGLDENWNETILRCLEKEPGDRPAGPEKVVKALEGEVELSPTRTLPHRKIVHTGKRFGGQPLVDPRIRWGTVAAAIAVFLALTVSLLRLPLVEKGEQIIVAVLPFTAIGQDPELQVLADGLMETVTRRLSQFEGMNEELLVIAASTVRSEGVNNAVEAGTRFGVQYAVEGGLQSQDQRLRLTLTLVTTEDGRQVETTVIEGTRDKALNLEDGAVARLATLLGLRLRSQHSGENSVGFQLPGAYEYYLQGIGYLQRHDQVASLKNAVELFQHARTIDPQSAAAYSGLANAYWFLFDRQGDRSFVDQAVQSAQKAIDLNENFQPAQVAMARVLFGSGEHERAIEHLDRATLLDSRDGEVYELLARSLVGLGRADEAEVAFRKAQALRPSDWTIYKQIGLFYLAQSRRGEAIDNLKTVVQLSPDNAQGWSNLGVALYDAERIDEAREAFQRSIEIEPRSSALANLGTLSFELGDYSTAAQYYRKATDLNPNNFLLWGNLGSAYLHSGDERYRQAYQEGLRLLDEQIEVRAGRQDLYGHAALYHATLGNLNEARAALPAAMANLDQVSSKDLVRLAEVYELLGERPKAVSLLRAALVAGYAPDKLLRMPTFRNLVQSSEWLSSSTLHEQVEILQNR